MSKLISIRLNGTEHEVAAGITITQLLDQAGYAGRRVAIERNGEIVPRSQHASTTLQANDHLELVQAIGGG